MSGRVVSLVAGMAVLAGLVAVVLSTSGSDAGGPRVSVLVREATNVAEGQYVREAGTPVGKVVSFDPVDGGRRAEIVLELQDEAWPLPEDSTLTLRWAGTVNFSNRYFALRRGKAARTWAEDERLPARAVSVPVEFDGLLRVFDQDLRADLRGMLGTAGPTFLTARPQLRRALDKAPPALEQADFVLGDLDAERKALDTLVRTGDRVLGAVDAAQPGVRDVLSGAADTFDGLAAEEANLRATIDRAPAAFAQMRSTLRRADPTLVRAQEVVRKLAPGVTEVRRIARPLNSVLGTIEDIGPDAKSTLASVRRAVPDLNPLVDELTRRAPQLQSIGEDAKEQLKCIRPYTPEVVSFFTNWGDFHSQPDGQDRVTRAQVMQFLPTASNNTPYTSADAKRLFPDLEFGFPRPPGTVAGQPWFLPECGAGPDAIDPNKDPEARLGEIFSVPKLRAINEPNGGSR